MSDPMTNDPIITLKIRNDIYEVEQTSLSKVKRSFILCTPCIARVMVNNPGYKHDVIHANITLAVCENCGACTFSSAMNLLGVNAYELNQLILTKRIHTVISRGVSYRVERIRFSL